MDRRGGNIATAITDIVIWWMVALVAVQINTKGAMAAALVVSLLAVLAGKNQNNPLLYITLSSVLEIVLRDITDVKWYPLLGAMVLYSSDMLSVNSWFFPASS